MCYWISGVTLFYPALFFFQCLDHILSASLSKFPPHSPCESFAFFFDPDYCLSKDWLPQFYSTSIPNLMYRVFILNFRWAKSNWPMLAKKKNHRAKLVQLPKKSHLTSFFEVEHSYILFFLNIHVFWGPTIFSYSYV